MGEGNGCLGPQYGRSTGYYSCLKPATFGFARPFDKRRYRNPLLSHLFGTSLTYRHMI